MDHSNRGRRSRASRVKVTIEDESKNEGSQNGASLRKKIRNKRKREKHEPEEEPEEQEEYQDREQSSEEEEDIVVDLDRPNKQKWKKIQFQSTDGMVTIEEMEEDEFFSNEDAAKSEANILETEKVTTPEEMEKKEKKKPKKTKKQKLEEPVDVEEQEQTEPKRPLLKEEDVIKEIGDWGTEWKEYSLHPYILKALKEKNFEEPTAIQKKTLTPAIRDRKDIVGAAQTVLIVDVCN